MTEFEMQKAAYFDRVPLPRSQGIVAINNVVREYADWSDNEMQEMFLLYDREAHDFTIFPNDDGCLFEAVYSPITEVIGGRGMLLDCWFDAEENVIDFWVKSKADLSPHLFKFFDCSDWVVM